MQTLQLENFTVLTPENTNKYPGFSDEFISWMEKKIFDSGNGTVLLQSYHTSGIIFMRITNKSLSDFNFLVDPVVQIGFIIKTELSLRKGKKNEINQLRLMIRPLLFTGSNAELLLRKETCTDIFYLEHDIITKIGGPALVRHLQNDIYLEYSTPIKTNNLINSNISPYHQLNLTIVALNLIELSSRKQQVEVPINKTLPVYHLELVLNIKKEIDSNPHIKMHIVSNIAKQHLSNRTTISKSFKRAFGVTLKEYIEQKVMEKAFCLVSQTEKSINEIADELGYSHSTNFSRKFTEYFGTQPHMAKRNGHQ